MNISWGTNTRDCKYYILKNMLCNFFLKIFCLFIFIFRRMQGSKLIDFHELRALTVALYRSNSNMYLLLSNALIIYLLFDREIDLYCIVGTTLRSILNLLFFLQTWTVHSFGKRTERDISTDDSYHEVFFFLIYNIMQIAIILPKGSFMLIIAHFIIFLLFSL